MSLNQEFGWPGGPEAWGQDGNFFSETKVRLTDETRMAEVREFDATAARRQYHRDTR